MVITVLCSLSPLARQTRREIEIDEVDCVAGAYAVHLQLHRGSLQAHHPGWSITHIMSGLLIWKVQEYDKAVEAARWLHRMGIFSLDATADELFAWKLECVDAARAVVEGLTSIAPRWPE
jgi:hypothetical protein